jgi:hypothetical protein
MPFRLPDPQRSVRRVTQQNTVNQAVMPDAQCCRALIAISSARDPFKDQ